VDFPIGLDAATASFQNPVDCTRLGYGPGLVVWQATVEIPAALNRKSKLAPEGAWRPATPNGIIIAVNALGRDGQRRERGMKAATDKLRLDSEPAPPGPSSPAPWRKHSTIVPRRKLLPRPTGVRMAPIADIAAPHRQLQPWGHNYVTPAPDNKLQRHRNHSSNFFSVPVGVNAGVRATAGDIAVATYAPRVNGPNAELAPANKNQSAQRLGGILVGPQPREFLASPKASEGGSRPLGGRGKIWANRLTAVIGLRIFPRVPSDSAEQSLF